MIIYHPESSSCSGPSSGARPQSQGLARPVIIVPSSHGNWLLRFSAMHRVRKPKRASKVWQIVDLVALPRCDRRAPSCFDELVIVLHRTQQKPTNSWRSSNQLHESSSNLSSISHHSSTSLCHPTSPSIPNQTSRSTTSLSECSSSMMLRLQKPTVPQSWARR
jgi:hypothetical protein